MKIKCHQCNEVRSFGMIGLVKRLEKQGIKMESFKKTYVCKFCRMSNKSKNK